MIEILVLITLSKNIAAKARAKGLSGGGFVVLLLVLWFGFEFGAMIAAMVVLGGDDNFLAAYGAALCGAALGGVLAFVIVGAVPAAARHDDYEEPHRDDYDDRPRRRDRDDRW
jgi:hypothetical protein